MNGTIECAFIGRLGQPPDLRIAKSGKEWLCLSVAVGKDDDTQWVSVAVFGDQAIELGGTLEKSDRVYCEGRLSLNVWNANGQTRTGLNVAASKVEPIGKIGRKRRKNGKSAEERQPANTNHVTNNWQAPAESISELNDEIPF